MEYTKNSVVKLFQFKSIPP